MQKENVFFSFFKKKGKISLTSAFKPRIQRNCMSNGAVHFVWVRAVWCSAPVYTKQNKNKLSDNESLDPACVYAALGVVAIVVVYTFIDAYIYTQRCILYNRILNGNADKGRCKINIHLCEGIQEVWSSHLHGRKMNL